MSRLATVPEREFWETQAETLEFLSDLAKKDGALRLSTEYASSAAEIRSIISYHNSRFPDPAAETNQEGIVVEPVESICGVRDGGEN